MKEFVVVGRPNSGKTLFVLNFAAFLGIKTLDILSRTYDNLITCKEYEVQKAQKLLCGPKPHITQSVQSITLKLSVGKSPINLKLNDTCGISEGIHSDVLIRKGMAQAIQEMRRADFIFHILDLSTINQGSMPSKLMIDEEIYKYGVLRSKYTLLANKIDLLFNSNHLSRLLELFPEANIIPISALQKNGFREVKACVLRNI